MRVSRSKSIKSPQHFFQIIGYVHDVVDGITYKGFAWNLFGISGAVVSECRKASANFCMFNTTFGLWSFLTFIGITMRRVVIAQGKLIQTARKHLN